MYSELKVFIVMCLMSEALLSPLAMAKSEADPGIVAACKNPDICKYDRVSQDGKSLDYAYLENSKTGEVFDCRGVGVAPIASEKNKCEPTGLAKEIEVLAAASVENACTDHEKEAMKNSCFAGAACMLASDISAYLNVVVPVTHVNLTKDIKACGGSESGCLKQMVLAVLKAMWDLVSGLGYLAKLAAGKAWDGLKYLGGKVAGVFASQDMTTTEQQYSDALILAQEIPPSFWDHPIENMTNLATSIAEDIWKTSRDLSGCQKWKGTPVISECEVSAPAWGCMSCQQKMSSLCSLTAYIGSDFIMSYLTGLGAGAILANGTIKASASLMAKSLAKIGKLDAVAAATKRAGQLARDSKAAEIAARTAQTAKSAATVAAKAVGEVFERINNIPGLKQYNALNQKAFDAGLRHGVGAVDTGLAKTTVKIADQIAEEQRRLQKAKQDLIDSGVPKEEATFLTDQKRGKEMRDKICGPGGGK